MASVSKRLYKGTLTASNATLYTAPSTANSYVVIKTITICNKTATDGWASINLDGGELLYQQLVPAKKTLIIIDIDQIIPVSALIEGLASAANTMSILISGKEVAP
jgi:hypothetical protein